MEIEQNLIEKRQTEVSTLLHKISKRENVISNISQLTQHCEQAATNFSDDVRILFEQVKHLSTFKQTFHPILLRDLHIILQELLNPQIDQATIFFEHEELQEAISIYQKAMTGNSSAQLELGEFYKSIDHADWAFVWYEALAKAGNIDAIYWLGNFYYDGTVVEENWEKTFQCYKEAALKGHADAMNNYADMYFRGEYVEKDDQKAFELFSIAAERGVAESMYTLGYMYENGVGIEKDLAKSNYWFTQSALAGDVFAANRLGNAAFQNNQGEEAIHWYQMAANQQDVDGEFNLGFCYESGMGTPINMKKAKYWYQRAALQGDAEAKKKLKEL